MQQGHTDYFERSQQEMILAHFIRCPRFHSLIFSGKVTQEDFDFIHLRVAFQAMLGVLSIQGNSGEVFVNAIVDQIRKIRGANDISPVELENLIKFISMTYSTQLAEDYYWGLIEDFVGQQRVYKELRTINAKDWRGAGEKLATTAFRSKVSMDLPYNPIATTTITPPIEPVPTGIAAIDSKLPGNGLGRKEYGILCAYTGVGKTTLSLNFAWGAARHRHKACYATLELDKWKITERFYSLVARYSYDAIRFGRPPHQSREECWQEAVERVIQNAGEYQDYFQIWDFSQEICTISVLEDWVRREISMSPENPPKVLFVDWLLCLDEDMKKADLTQLSGKEVRHKLQRYSDELSKKIARKYDIAVWATHQADGKAEGQEIVTTKHSAEGKSASWKCSVFLGVGATADQKDKGVFTVTASKTRDGRNFTAKIRGVLSEQRFESIEEGEDPTPEAVRQSGIEAAIAAGNTTVNDEQDDGNMEYLIPVPGRSTFRVNRSEPGNQPLTPI